jgi:hypothetical protein
MRNKSGRARIQLLSPQHAVRGEIKIYLHADLSSTLQLVKFLIYWGDFNTHTYFKSKRVGCISADSVFLLFVLIHLGEELSFYFCNQS